MELKDTVKMMTSEDKHERLKAEYLQAKIRFKESVEQRGIVPKANENGKGISPETILQLHRTALIGYIRSLERIARREGIDLKSLTI